MNRRDLLRECNDKDVPLEDFSRQFCVRCLQPECSRSLVGKSKFEQRVSGWEDKLFKQPPRMDLSDPRYEIIRGKRFQEVQTGPVLEIGRGPWQDPRDLAEPKAAAPALKPAASVAPPSPSAEPVQDVEEEGPATDPTPPEAKAEETPATPSATPPARNTPFRQGQMIAGANAPAPKTNPVYDPWAAPKPSQADGLQVVKPGARIKLGG